MSNKIEQTIADIEDYIETCKPARLSPGNILVNKEELESLLSDLRVNTPDEIRYYQKIISNQDAILADARAKADSIVAEAQVKKEELVSEHEIMQKAYAQANEVVLIATRQAQDILDKAAEDANNTRLAAIDYTDECLKAVEKILSNAVISTQNRYENLITTLSESLQEVVSNRPNPRSNYEKQGLRRCKQRSYCVHYTKGCCRNRLPDVQLRRRCQRK